MNLGLVRGSLLKKLLLVISGQGVQFQCRLFLFGPGIDIWRSCRFIGALMRSLCFLPGGLGRFVPCSIGANHSGFVTLGGKSVVMVSLLGLVRVLQSSSCKVFF